MVRHADQQIANMDGTAALPRRNGELVFHDDWERRIFALAVTLCEQGHFRWDDFREELIASIAAHDNSAESADLSNPGYYVHWLTALEKTLSNIGMILPD